MIDFKYEIGEVVGIPGAGYDSQVKTIEIDGVQTGTVISREVQSSMSIIYRVQYGIHAYNIYQENLCKIDQLVYQAKLIRKEIELC